MVKGELKNQEWVSPTMDSTSDGALYFNVLDLAKWDGALYTEKLLKRASLDQMWTVAQLNDGKPNKGNYGFAWAIDQVNGHKVIEHGGAWQGFTTYIARYVDDKLTVIVLTNLAGANPGRIAHGVAGFYYAALAPKEPKTIALDPKIFDAYVGEYQLSANVVLAISREGDKFYVEASALPKAQMFAESETKFFLKEMDAQITFVKDARGKVTHLDLHQGRDRE